MDSGAKRDQKRWQKGDVVGKIRSHFNSVFNLIWFEIFWFPALITLLIEDKRNSGLTSFYLQQRPPTPSPGFFSAPFPLVPLSRATPAIFLGASQTFHVLPYLDGPTLRFNHFLTKVYQMLKKGLFQLGPSAKIIWKVKMSPVKPIVLRLKVLGEGEHCSRELK